MAGAWAIGKLGASIGSWSGPAGMAIGGIVGGIIGGIAGSMGCSFLIELKLQ